MSDQATGPDNKPTAKIDQIEVFNARLDKFSDLLDSGIRAIRVDIGLVSNDLTVVKSQVSTLTQRVDVIETASTRRSDAVKAVSLNDMEQAAQLAHERTAREALAHDVTELKAVNVAQVESLVRLERVASSILGNKKVRIAGYAVLLIIIAIAARFGIHIEVPK